MKGAIGNAFIMNMVITFIVIFYMLLIGSMAYSKAYRTKNYLLNQIVESEERVNPEHIVRRARKEVKNDFMENVNQYLAKVGYGLTNKRNSCPTEYLEDNSATGGKQVRLLIDTSEGYYDYCLYLFYSGTEAQNSFSKYNYFYRVLVYMKFDFPIIGDYIRIPLIGDTKGFWNTKVDSST